jgi:hypothetical protein
LTLLAAAALLVGSIAVTGPAAADDGSVAQAAKKKCKKKGAAAAKKKCKKKKKPITPTTPTTPPTPTPASLSILPTTHNFTPGMPIALGGMTNPHTFTVTNSGGSPSGPLTTTITGANPMQFGITSQNCSGMPLAAFSTCFINARYQSALIGTQTATLTVTGAPGGTVTSSLSGSGTI